MNYSWLKGFTLSLMFGSAPCLSKTWTHSVCPLAQAWCSAVNVNPSLWSITPPVWKIKHKCTCQQRWQKMYLMTCGSSEDSDQNIQPGVILEGNLGEKVSQSWLTSPYLELREKWKCIESIGISKIWTKTSPWNPGIVTKLLPLWKLKDDPCTTMQ